MAYNTRALSDIRDEIYNRFEVDDDFYPTAEMNRAINVAYRDYHTFLTSLSPDLTQSTTPESVSVSSGTDTYSLTADAWRINGVDVQEGSDWFAMERTNWRNRNRLQNSGADKLSTTYRSIGGKLILSPSPSWSGTVRVWYVAAPATLTLDADTITIPVPGSEDYIPLHVLIQYCGKTEQDPSIFAAQLNALKQQIAGVCDPDMENPDCVQDTWGNRYRALRMGAYPRYPRPEDF